MSSPYDELASRPGKGSTNIPVFHATVKHKKRGYTGADWASCGFWLAGPDCLLQSWGLHLCPHVFSFSSWAPLPPCQQTMGHPVWRYWSLLKNCCQLAKAQWNDNALQTTFPQRQTVAHPAWTVTALIGFQIFWKYLYNGHRCTWFLVTRYFKLKMNFVFLFVFCRSSAVTPGKCCIIDAGWPVW